ncbi:urease accessory protein UreD [Rhodovibrionaceae bacterium A322]
MTEDLLQFSHVDVPPTERRPGRLQRVQGVSRLGVGDRDGRTHLVDLYQSGAAKIRLPKVYDHPGLEAVLINTAGGLTDGDSLRVDLEVGPGAQLLVTTQACEKIYRSLGGPARVENHLTLQKGAKLCWLPQETLFFDRANLQRHLTVDLSEGASFLAMEPLVFGRAAMGEIEVRGRLHDRWRVSCEGRLIYAEDNRLSGNITAQLSAAAVAGGASVFASGFYLGPDCQERLTALRALPEEEGVTAGVSQVRQHLVLRAVAQDSLAFRRWMQRLYRIFEMRDLPRAWSC